MLGISYHTLNSYLRYPLVVQGEVEPEDDGLLDAGEEETDASVDERPIP